MLASIFKQMHTIHVILVLEWRYHMDMGKYVSSIMMDVILVLEWRYIYHMDMGKYISYIQWINVS